jgi:hypothetical protein
VGFLSRGSVNSRETGGKELTMDTWAVIRNVYGLWQLDEAGLTRQEAIQLVIELIEMSHGGEVVAVPEPHADRYIGQRCTDVQPHVWLDARANVVGA